MICNRLLGHKTHNKQFSRGVKPPRPTPLGYIRKHPKHKGTFNIGGDLGHKTMDPDY